MLVELNEKELGQIIDALHDPIIYFERYLDVIRENGRNSDDDDGEILRVRQNMAEYKQLQDKLKAAK